MKEFEKEIVEVTKSLILGGLNSLSGWNNPLTKLAETLIKDKFSLIESIFTNGLDDALKSEEFKSEVKKAIAQKVARTMVSESESCIAKSVQKLKQNEAFRAKLTIAIDNIVRELEK